MSTLLPTLAAAVETDLEPDSSPKVKVVMKLVSHCITLEGVITANTGVCPRPKFMPSIARIRFLDDTAHALFKTSNEGTVCSIL